MSNKVKKIVNKAEKTPEDSKIFNAIKIKTQLYRTTTDFNKYRSAVVAAENIYTPLRYNLYQLYQQTELDPQVTSCISQRKTLTLSSEFYVYNKDGSENDEKTKLIRTKWFKDFVSMALDSIYWGHSLVQFDSIANIAGVDQFKDVELVPRQYVKPEFHRVSDAMSSGKDAGVDYTEEPYSNWCIAVGGKKDLGLFLKLTPLVIWKKNAMGAWAEYIEKFGSPLRLGYTDSTDTESVQNMQAMLENMSVAAWGLFKMDDKVEIKADNRPDAYEVYDKMIERCNSEISKLILNQTMTTDDGSSRSQAEVHERILENVGMMDKDFIYNVNNNQLLPLLNNLGFGLENCYIDIESEDEFTMEEKAKFDIELLKTGKFTFTPEYLKDEYGTEAIPVIESPDTELKDYKNVLSKYYH